MPILEQVARRLISARQVSIITGAGMSKESGIPTFREAQTGLWSQYNPEQLATPQAFKQNPDRVWAWYRSRYHRVMEVQPNAGHHAIAELEQLAPNLAILTQNVDGLHVRAGSKNVIELHGNITRYRCSANCQGDRTYIDLSTITFDDEHAPLCPFCSAHIRPDVVWFGESLPHDALTLAVETCITSDVVVVIGTSGIVQPVASLPGQARRSGAAIIEINPAPSLVTPSADIFLQAAAGEILPQLVDRVKSLRGTDRL